MHLDALEAKTDGDIASSHPVMSWLVQHVADLITKHSIGPDGRMPYERLYPKLVREEGFEFGDKVWWRRHSTQDMNVDLDKRWCEGHWLGRKWGSNLHSVAVGPDSVIEVRAVCRVPKKERWSREQLGALRAFTWGAERTDAERLVTVIPPKAGDTPATQPQVQPPPLYIPRSVYITKEDLEKYGYTLQCRRCQLMRADRSVRGVRHMPECRQRLEARLQEDGDPRVDAAAERKNEAIAERVEANITGTAAPPAEEERENEGGRSSSSSSDIKNMENNEITEGRSSSSSSSDSKNTENNEVTGHARLSPQDAGHARLSPQDTERLQSEDAKWCQKTQKGPKVREQTDEQMTDTKTDMNAENEEMEIMAVEEETDEELQKDMWAPIPVGAYARADELCELLLIEGVAPGVAREKVCELYSQPRVTKEPKGIPHLCLEGGATFDLRQDSESRSWNFVREVDRQEVRRRIATEKPFMVIGSPPINLNHKNMHPAEVRRRVIEARIHLDFCIEIYKMQVENWRHFLHEHPVNAKSWEYPPMRELRNMPRIGEVIADLCQYGMRARTRGGGSRPSRKRTRFLSSAPAVLAKLWRRCKHAHQPLVNGRAAAAAIYPPQLCKALLVGIDAQRRREGQAMPLHVQKEL